MDSFREAIDFCDLHDLGYEGDIFTWRNQQTRAAGYIRERLDRALANEGWRQKFPTVVVQNGDPRRSDHRPVIIITDRPLERGPGAARSFSFEAGWLEEEKCEEVVMEGWEQGVAEGLCKVDQLVRKVAGGLNSWSSNVLGAWEKQKKKLKKELELCRRSPLTNEGVAREAAVRFQLDKIEEQIDIYWKQRSHTKWLEKGDRNTKFFHAACSERRRRNRIGRLQNGVGGCVEEVEKQDFITNFFSTAFPCKCPGRCTTAAPDSSALCHTTNEQ
jgi:hypothetical protein